MAINMEFFVNEAWRSMKRGGIMSFTAFAIVYVSLVILGLFLLILFNLNTLIGSIGDKMDIMAYTDAHYSRAGADNIRTMIQKIPGVVSLQFIPKEEAWNKFKEGFSALQLEAVVENNPLPDAFRVKTRTLDQIPAVAKALQNINGIDDVRYGGEIATRIEIFNTVIRIVGFGIIALLIIATLVIVVNTIKLTVLARRSEIHIMRLVGATNSFIRWPFILEGVFIGTFGAAGAALSLKVAYDLLANRLQAFLPFLPIAFNPLEINLVYLFILLCGIFLGLIGAMLSIDQSLRLTQT